MARWRVTSQLAWSPTLFVLTRANTPPPLLHTGTEGKEFSAHLLSIVVEQQYGSPAEDMADTLVKAGGVQPLVALVASGSNDGQIYAAETLASIASNHPLHGDSIVAAGGILPLVGLLKQGSQKAQRGAAAALAKISDNRDHQRPIIRVGALAPLVRLLRVGIADAQVHALSSPPFRLPSSASLPHARAGPLPR